MNWLSRLRRWIAATMYCRASLIGRALPSLMARHR
jgi:hypothetical protein